jgi:hypothetical protein
VCEGGYSIEIWESIERVTQVTLTRGNSTSAETETSVKADMNICIRNGLYDTLIEIMSTCGFNLSRLTYKAQAKQRFKA